MNSVSLGLSSELHEISGWETGVWRTHKGVKRPVYDLGYLIPMIPRQLILNGEPTWLHLYPVGPTGSKWAAEYIYSPIERSSYAVHGETIEDAVARLAIELLRQGAITRGGDR